MAAIPMNEQPCGQVEVGVCHFAEEERAELRKVANRESVAFPRWALALLIAILTGLAGSNAAIWSKVESRATSEELKMTRIALETELVRVKERLLVLENTVPKEYPPKWFEKQFDDLVQQVNENNKILTDLRIEVRSLTATDANKKGP